jgi:Methyltransferase domain
MQRGLEAAKSAEQHARDLIRSSISAVACELSLSMIAASTPVIGFEPAWIKLETPAWLEHTPFASWLIGAHRPSLVVELGTHYGNSYFAICQAVREQGLAARCFAVDTWRGDEHTGPYGDDVYDAVFAYNAQNYGAFSRCIRSTFDEALQHFQHGSIDLLHIDGRHGYDAVRHDFESWRPYLSNRAIVLFHDITVVDADFGVHRLWAELVEQYPSFEFLHAGGLGVLGVGGNHAPAVRDLFGAGRDPGKAVAIRDLFWRSAAGLRMRRHFGWLAHRAGLPESDMRSEVAATSALVIQEAASSNAAAPHLAKLVSEIEALQVKLLMRAREQHDIEARHAAELELLRSELQQEPAHAPHLAGASIGVRARGHVFISRVVQALRPDRQRAAAVAEKAPEIDATALVAQSPLFDASHYLAQLPTGTADAARDPARHYAHEGWWQGLDPGPLFSTSEYLERYSDVAADGMNPLVHFIVHGSVEGRRGWSDKRLLDWQGDLLMSPDVALDMTEKRAREQPWPQLRRGDTVAIHAHSRGNFFFQQFQHMLGEAFGAIGVGCLLANEVRGMDIPQPSLRIVVAPHEFFYLGGATSADWPDYDRTILLNTEQMQTSWFARALPSLFAAPYILDMNIQVAASLVRLGCNARFLPLGYVEGAETYQLQRELPDEAIVRSLPKRIGARIDSFDCPMSQRPLDILYVGSITHRREAFFARNAGLFAARHSFLHLTRLNAPLRIDDPDHVSPRAFAALAQRSKIVLNIHRDEAAYFEWQRIVQYGLLQNACVVTERSTRVPGLEPGRHYFEDDLDKLPALITWLLDNPQGRAEAEKVRVAGALAARTAFDLSRSLAEIFSVGEGPRS